MTPRQLDRRRRVLDAVHELLAERSLSEIQVKDIADRAQVSLAAIYRYFSSKEHLLAEALVDWAEHGSLAQQRDPHAASVSERFVTLLRWGLQAYRRSPQYAELFLESSTSRDHHAVASMGRLSKLMNSAMKPALEGLDPEAARDVWMTIGYAWVGGLFQFVHGRTTFADLEKSLLAVARLLVAPLEVAT